jgi:phospholipase C
MEDLKQRLQTDLSYVEVVHFDEDGNWYLHKNAATKNSLTREEVLKGFETFETETEVVPTEDKTEVAPEKEKTFKRKK